MKEGWVERKKDESKKGREERKKEKDEEKRKKRGKRKKERKPKNQKRLKKLNIYCKTGKFNYFNVTAFATSYPSSPSFSPWLATRTYIRIMHACKDSKRT